MVNSHTGAKKNVRHLEFDFRELYLFTWIKIMSINESPIDNNVTNNGAVASRSLFSAKMLIRHALSYRH